MSVFYNQDLHLHATFAEYQIIIFFMKRLVSFFEIPATDFERAVKFYESLFKVTLPSMDCGHEKMAFFPEEEGVCPGAIS